MNVTRERRWWSAGVRTALIVLAILAATGKSDLLAQAVLDICGCASDPTLLPFDAGNPATYPPGTSGCSTACTSGTITLPVPPSGVLRFSSFTADGGFSIFFSRNNQNTPVTILVSGNIRLRGSFGCCQPFSVSGAPGGHGQNGIAGVGGAGGPGGFRGGDGAALGVSLVSIGGAGFGPGGGTGGQSAAAVADGGTFFGVPELVPLVGGSGGGGGMSNGTTANCTGGGGGGGGGGLLMAANGTIFIQNIFLDALGGTGGTVGNGNCASGGGGGAGGAIRLVASSFIDGGAAFIRATGGGVNFNARSGTPGRIRFETIDTSGLVGFAPDPPALRIVGPGPLANPVSPTVSITRVGGSAVPATPLGFAGAIDIVLPAPGVTGVDISTSGVPSGTTVEVKVKPRVGALPVVATVPLTNCDTQGNCTATTSFNLSAGAYVVEARATFQVP